MKRYIPKGVIEKQYSWEWVNYKLYYRLSQVNSVRELDSSILHLLQVQEKQLPMLRSLASATAINVTPVPDEIKFYTTELETAEELYNREYQLLQEYYSYQIYFLRTLTYGHMPLQGLIESQIEQVNTLLSVIKVYKAKEEAKKQALLQPAVPFDAELEKGYRLERVAANLTYPTCITFDNKGAVYVIEAGYAYDEPKKGRLLKLDENTVIEIINNLEGPVTGVIWKDGFLYVAESNIKGEGNQGGCILKIGEDGTREVIVSGLATYGDHFTGDVIFGPDNRLYFSVGTATNSGVVGPDNGSWLSLHPKFHDKPARAYELDSQNFISKDAKITGAFHPFGEQTTEDKEQVPSTLFATGVVYSCNPDGSHLRIIADGFRNTFGMAFSPFDGKLYATDNGADSRGTRPVENDWDHFWLVEENGWYGWPDFFSGLPAILPHFTKKGNPTPLFLLKQHPKLAMQPIIRFAANTSSNKFDFSTNKSFGHVGEIFVAQTGAISYKPGTEAPGFRVVRADLQTGQIRDFLVNTKAEENPHGPIRPVQAKFNPAGDTLYIVDFGILGNYAAGTKPKPNTGSIWKVVKE